MIRVQQLLVWCSIGMLPLACGGGSSSPTTSVGGGSASGGATASSSGGALAVGGTSSTGGTATTSGGAASGGAATASGGAATSGAASGGAASGGAASGGAASGGAAGTNAGGTGGSVGGSGGRAGNAGSSGAGGIVGGGGTGSASPNMNFFVTSDKSTTGNLGGLAGADMRCQRLAVAAGFGARTWRAYLSTEVPPINARDRIGEGPYYNSKGVMLAATKAALHAIHGDHTLFIDEHGAEINGQWNGAMVGSATNPLEHDVLTGSMNDGTISVGNTCGNWTAITGNSFVGHTDGEGPGMSTALMYTYWAGSHQGQCANTAPAGGAGRLYCFVGP